MLNDNLAAASAIMLSLQRAESLGPADERCGFYAPRIRENDRCLLCQTLIDENEEERPKGVDR